MDGQTDRQAQTESPTGREELQNQCFGLEGVLVGFVLRPVYVRSGYMGRQGSLTPISRSINLVTLRIGAPLDWLVVSSHQPAKQSRTVDDVNPAYPLMRNTP